MRDALSPPSPGGGRIPLEPRNPGQERPAPIRRPGLLAALLVMVAGAWLAGVLFVQARDRQRVQVQAAFHAAASDRIEAVDRGLRHGFEAVLTLRDHIVASGRVDAASFRAFAGPLHRRHPDLQALQWLPAVGPGNRAALEAEGRRSQPGFRFFTRDAGGKVQPIPPEAHFHAVLLVEPLKGNEVTPGYAATQLATRQEALARALATGEVSATGPIKLLQESGDQFGFLALVPVPGPDGRALGMAQGVFRAGDLVRGSLAALEPQGVSVRLSAAPKGEAPLTLHLERSRLPAGGSAVPDLRLERTFERGGRTWTVEVRPEAGHFLLAPGWRAWLLLATVGAFTLLLAAWTRATLERTEQVRALVVERTRELRAETERHRQDAQALRESEARYRHLVEAMEEGMWILDGAGLTRFANRRLAALLGLPREELAGRAFASLLADPARAPKLLAGWRAGEGAAQDLCLRRGDGGELWALVSASVVSGPDGGPDGLLLMLVDITERRRLEEQQLQRQKLESLGVLAGGIAHDFNNLLAAMLGNLGIAQLSLPEGSEAAEHLENLERSVQRAAHLTRQMLAYSGRARSLVAPLDLNQTVQEISHLLAVSLSKKVRLAYELAPTLPALSADAAQVQQVVMNLVTNASEAIGDQEGTVTLHTALAVYGAEQAEALFPGQGLEPGPCLTLEVRDTGAGMTPEVQARIFEPFFSTKFSGRGLGLSSMLGIVRGHRGGIRIDSRPGLGTSFLVAFPLGQGTLEAPAEVVAEEGWRGAGTLLLAEDEDDVRSATEALLRNLGFEVVAVVDGREALDRFAADPAAFRAVLMDFTMPRMNGLEAFQAMRRVDPACRVVLMSGFHDPSALGGEDGARLAAFLQKPFRRVDLVRALAQALEV